MKQSNLMKKLVHIVAINTNSIIQSSVSTTQSSIIINHLKKGYDAMNSKQPLSVDKDVLMIYTGKPSFITPVAINTCINNRNRKLVKQK